MAIVYLDDEIGNIAACFRAIAVGYFQSQVMVLHIGPHPGMGLGDPAELRFPIAIEDDPVDVATVRSRFPPERLGGIEIDMDC
ncbi:MAG: hypothetical protein BWY09_01949 [Candidatus Hydrogenedentes bacterium ADurb.Bin179]|nr:MAG: hypothetical protein BWY09_01949 [Candidatus Hydrogenedentes bacterium ADurb.Bin179]